MSEGVLGDRGPLWHTPAVDRDTSIGIVWREDEMAGRFSLSLARLLLVANPVNHVLDVMSGPDLDRARNLLVEDFLKTDDEYLLMLDTDMVFTPEAPLRLAMAAGPEHVVAGFCVNNQGTPTLYTWDHDDFRDPDPKLIPADKIVRVDGTGAACMMIPRQVLDLMEYGTWFTKSPPYSEDLSFCLKLKEAGVPLAVHTGAKFGHSKSHVLWP